jgi:hypothetical protein
LLAATRGAAQAWVPESGEGEFSLIYQNVYTRDHLDANGAPIDAGKIRVVALIESFDLGVTNKLAVTTSIPLVAGKYNGSFPHQFPIDNGNYHGGIGDMRLAVRYQLRERPLTFTPFLSVSFPTVPYQHFAHSAIGSDMWEISLGVSAGRRLDPWLPKTYVQTRYAYVITQNVSIPSFHYSVRPNRSRIDAEIGYFLTRRLAVRGLATSQVTHDGLDAGAFPPSSMTLSNELWRHHDQISAMHYLNAGVGVSFSVNRKVDTFVAFEKTAWGENTHALNAGISAGVTWTFKMPWARREQSYQQLAAERPKRWHSKPTELKLCH